MKIQNLSNSPKVPFDLDAFVLHSQKELEIIHLLLKPGDHLTEHKNPFDVIFYVIDGSGILNVDSESLALKYNDIIKVTKEKNRSWTNTSEHDLRILVIKLL